MPIVEIDCCSLGTEPFLVLPQRLLRKTKREHYKDESAQQNPSQLICIDATFLPDYCKCMKE